jgi:integrase
MATWQRAGEEVDEPAGTSAKVLGPYCNGTKWRLVVKDGSGRRAFLYAPEEEALMVRARLLNSFVDLANRTVGEVIDEFLAHKRQKGCMEVSITSLRNKLFLLLPLSKPLAGIKPQTAERLYLALTERVAVMTHQKSLRNTKELFRYCIKKRYVAANPFADVQPIGKANVGKKQLRHDEARKLCNYLISESEKGDRFALALLVQVTLGLRSGEVLNLRARDLDRGATLVVIDGTKTKNAKRCLELASPIVRDLLLKRSKSLPPDAPIFAEAGATGPSLSSALQRALAACCRKAGVPIVCPHSLRGLHSSLAVKAGATSAFVAQALGHGSDAVTRRHYIDASALDAARTARVADTLLGDADLDRLVADLRALSAAQFARVCAALGLSTASS